MPSVGVPLNAATATLESYAFVLFEHDATRRAFRNSFGLSATAAIVIVLAAVPLAYFLVWRRSRALRVVNLATELPYALPGVVLAIAAILLFLKPVPVLGITLYNTVWILLFCYLARFLVLGLRPVVSGYYQLDRTLEEAAQIAGARLLRRLRTILLPAARAGRSGGRAAHLPDCVQRADDIRAAVVVGCRDAGRHAVLVPAGRRRDLRRGARTLTVVVSVALMLSTLLVAHKLPPGVLPWRD